MELVLIQESKKLRKASRKESSEICWRCGGTGEVRINTGEVTPCGACLGTKVPPKPCPSCGSLHAKIMLDVVSEKVLWRCRNCGFRGPSHKDDMKAMRLWNKQKR